jgi:hypothetical protein
MEKVSYFKKMRIIKEESLLAALSNYARTLFRREISSSQQKVHVLSGAWLRNFDWFPAAKGFSWNLSIWRSENPFLRC